jgi:hypothetical protein
MHLFHQSGEILSPKSGYGHSYCGWEGFGATFGFIEDYGMKSGPLSDGVLCEDCWVESGSFKEDTNLSPR